MNLDIIESTKEGEITQFLCDVRDYFKASLATSEYENTSNIFYVNASEKTEKLLSRCEGLIKRLNKKNEKESTNGSPSGHILDSTLVTDSAAENKRRLQQAASPKNNKQDTELEDVSYLDMSVAAYEHTTSKGPSNEGKLKATDCESLEDTEGFRCSIKVVEHNRTFLHEIHGTDSEHELKDKIIKKEGSDDEDVAIVLEEKPNKPPSHAYSSLPHIDCPYIDLPAGHLSIYKSTKYGQLQKIEKKLFFDQTKKCYCGILNDWLLCYVNGPTSSRPTVSLYLKMPNIEVEHYGEGKRRDVCFQILTGDTNNKYLFQAINEIDAKEWIHAIETSIRSEVDSLDVNNLLVRKLPTPPLVKNISFLSSFQRNYEINTTNDGIYEEPAPIQSRDLITTCSEQPPELPSKHRMHSTVTKRLEYDVPKCPKKVEESIQSDPNYLEPAESLVETGETRVFQAIVKDVHNKLSSQLLSVSYPKKPLKKSVTSSLKANGDVPSSAYNLALSPVNEMKKQDKLTSNTSPPKEHIAKTSITKNWFLNKINKSSSATRSNSLSPSNSPPKSKQSEKENLLNSSSDTCNAYEMSDINFSSSPASPILKQTNSPRNGKGKVNMIINQLEASGHLVSKFSADAVASMNSFCESDYNNYEPIVTVSTPPSKLIKKN